jgi:predicted enzyme related to lactoylglutathione lyase
VSRPPLAARFGHVNLVARDWRALARFYTEVFGCVPVPPERDYSGPDLAAGTALPGARLRGVHLRLPGFEAMGDGGPTLEIYTYDSPDAPGGVSPEPPVHRPGFGHVAFVVPDVAAARETLLAAGGAAVGEVVTSVTATGGRVTWCYCRDPEGNVVELQRWA